MEPLLNMGEVAEMLGVEESTVYSWTHRWMSFSFNNKQHRRSTGTADKKLAELILAKARVQVVEGKWFEEKEEAFDELAFASQLVMAGVDITTVKELMGHADIKTTLRYAHLAPSHKIRALEIFDNVLNVKESDSKLQDQTNYHKFTIPADVRKVEGL